MVRIIWIVLCLFQTGLIKAKDYISIPPAIYEDVARKNRVPAKLLYSIILNESRSITTLQSKRKFMPWPWTINHNGKGYYFQTREAAHQYIAPFIEKGESMGIGLGQIEWRWHKEKFQSSWDALDPKLNLQVAAAYLREQFERKECSSWELAVGCYHRPAQGVKDKQIAQKYTQRVLNIWKEIR